MVEISPHVSVITININGLKSSIKSRDYQNGYKNKIQVNVAYKSSPNTKTE